MRATKGSANAIDIHVGEKLRAIRIEKNVSQEKLGEAVGLTFQQIQKYEKGTNRIAASRLYQFAETLNVSILDFYSGLPFRRTYRSRRSPHAKERAGTGQKSHV